ncbi:MAG: hypothetical protein KI792_09240 [Alphaproteobacteria bacterium]|nr:hypothetical protein [Alphaproteobacteria bacterium SS10]
MAALPAQAAPVTGPANQDAKLSPLDAGQQVQETVNDNAHLLEQVEARIADLGYLCDSRTLYGHGGRDVYYLVGDTNRRLTVSQWEVTPFMTFERFDGDEWRVLWQGSINSFVTHGPHLDSVSPVGPRLRRLGATLASLRAHQNQTFCRWIENRHGALELRVTSLDPSLDGRRLMLGKAGLNACLREADGILIKQKPVSKLVCECTKDCAMTQLQEFLSTPARALSTTQFGSGLKTFGRTLASFLTHR